MSNLIAQGDASTSGKLPSADVNDICKRLSIDPNLVLPSSQYRDGGQPSQTQIYQYLIKLLNSFPAAFLERYGKLLTDPELRSFELLGDDYEVGFWLQHYGLARAAAEASTSTGRLPAAIKNRRLAAMQRLQQEGSYFSHHSMRERAPLLYHQYIGQYIGAEAPGDADEATAVRQEKLSEGLMRQHDEVLLQLRLASEREEEEAQLSEQESSDEEESESEPGDQQEQQPAVIGTWPAAAEPSATADKEAINPAELLEKQRQFVQEMESRFLLGQDQDYVDYAQIDADMQLDDHWLEQRGRDAEDKYFDDVGWGEPGEGSPVHQMAQPGQDGIDDEVKA